MWWAGLVQAGLGVVQTAVSAAAASKLPKQQKYKEVPEMGEVMGRYRAQADQGYSPAERAAFNQRMARQTNASMRNISNMGLSSLGPALSNMFNVEGQNQFSAASSGVRRAGLAGMTNIMGQKQSLADRNVSTFNRELSQKRQALGMGMQTGTKNMVGGVTGALEAKFAQDQGDASKDALSSGNIPPHWGHYRKFEGPGYVGSNISGQSWYENMYGPEWGAPINSAPLSGGSGSYPF